LPRPRGLSAWPVLLKGAFGITTLAMVTITCKLPDSLAAKLDAAVREQRSSKSAILREALEHRLHAGRKPVVSAFDLVKQLCGSIEEGPTDLATNPEHLNGFGE
jgi:hypothetical protein